MTHDERRGSEFDILSAYRALVGTILIVIGVVLALHLVTVVFELIEGKEPPGLIDQLVTLAVEKLEGAEDVANKNVPIDLSPDLKKALVYGLIVLFLIIPASIATSLVSCGGKMMKDDAGKSLKQIAAKLNQR